MTASTGRSGFSEGAAVVVASVMLMAGLAGLMAWRVWAPGAALETEGAGEALGEKVVELEGKLEAAETAAAGLRSEVSELTRKLGQAEAERLDAVASATVADQTERTRVRELVAENEQMQAQMAELVRQIKALETEVMVPTELTTAVGTQPPAALDAAIVDGHSVSAKVLHNVRVVDANEDLAYVVLDAGKQDGVRVGMVFHVMDGDQVVAKLRAADVRTDLTGATVEGETSQRFPRVSDRVILRQYSD